jgi:hypothetical protein
VSDFFASPENLCFAGGVLENPLTDSFQPTLLGTEIIFEEADAEGMITDENECEILIESDLFTGWMSKALFWELSGAE